MIRRIREVIGKEAKIVATGGYAKLVREHSESIDFMELSLVLEGIRLIYERKGKHMGR